MTIEDRVMKLTVEKAVNILIEKKAQLKEDYANGLMNYVDYKTAEFDVQSDLDSLYSASISY